MTSQNRPDIFFYASTVPTLGHRIQKLRLRQQRTLEAVAGECGFTKSLLSKIECGKTTPPIATLMRIATALGVNISDLLSQDVSSSTVYTPGSGLQEQLTLTEKGYLFHLFAGKRPDKLMQPFLFVARKGEVHPGRLSHRGEEFIYVLAGEMVFSVANIDYKLGPGDSLYFDSEQTHDLAPISEKVVYLAIFADVPHAAKAPSPARKKRI